MGRRIPLQSAAFAYPKPDHAAEYALRYSEQLVFDAASTAIRFDARLLSLPVVQRPEALKIFMRTAPQSVFMKYKNEGSMMARLRRRLRNSIGQPDWPLLEAIAREFHMSPTTLRRRLEAEFTSYQDTKDEVLRDAAVHYLYSTGLNVVAIGTLLGFQESTAFRRASKKWSRVQLGEYRRRQAIAGSAQRTAVAPR